MKLKHFVRAIDRIYATSESELDCDDVQAHLPEYVEFELTGNDPAVPFSDIAAHLNQCPNCIEEYHGLLEVARLEVQARLPHPDQILNAFPEGETVSTDITRPEIHPELVPAAGR